MQVKEKRYASHVKQARDICILADYLIFCFLLPSYLPAVVFALVLQLPPVRDYYPGSHSRLPPPPPALLPCKVRASTIYRGEKRPTFFPRVHSRRIV